MAALRENCFEIEPVKKTEDVPVLAEIFDEALRHGDTFHEVMTRCGTESVYDSGIKHLEAGLDDPEHNFLFKAVMLEEGKRKIVGCCHWSVGFISIPKVDPFASKTEVSNTSTEAGLVDPVSLVTVSRT